MSPEQVKALSDRIIKMLPDDPHDAVVVMAISFANVACSVGLTDAQALDGVARALKQIRPHLGAKCDG